MIEHEVRVFIAEKSYEMRRLEDDVRNEVELLWNKYANVPGKKEEMERSRSTSANRDVDSHRRRESVTRFISPSAAPVTSAPTSNPVSEPALASPPSNAAGSLLSASLSANAFYKPTPPAVANKVEDSILELSQTVDKQSDARAVAMSHMFSVLDDVMDGQARKQRRASANKTREEVEQEEARAASDLIKDDFHQKDSWIDEERKVLEEAEDKDVTTPKPSSSKSLPEEKGKKAVKFEEPEKPQKSPQTQEDLPEDRDNDGMSLSIVPSSRLQQNTSSISSLTTSRMGPMAASQQTLIHRAMSLACAIWSKTTYHAHSQLMRHPIVQLGVDMSVLRLSTTRSVARHQLITASTETMGNQANSLSPCLSKSSWRGTSTSSLHSILPNASARRLSPSARASSSRLCSQLCASGV